MKRKEKKSAIDRQSTSRVERKSKLGVANGKELGTRNPKFCNVSGANMSFGPLHVFIPIA